MITRAQIQAFVDQVHPYNYTPAQLNQLTQALLDFSNNFWVSTIAADVPTASDDETLGYSNGSSGFNSATGRLYTCVDASEGAAVWALSSSDVGVQALTMTNGATIQSLVNTAAITLSGSVTNYTLKLPANPYTGKQVTIFIVGSVGGTLTIQSSAGTSVGALTPTTLDTYTYAWNGTAWIQVGFAGTIA